MKDACILTEREKKEMKDFCMEQRDERNIALGNAAKARAYEFMMCAYAIIIVVLGITGVISQAAFFILLGVFVTCQAYFIIRLWKYHKEG